MFMKVIREHIKKGEYKRFYLIYGSEEYLKKLYRDKMKAAIINDGGDINYSYFEGKDIEPVKLISVAQTLPFFADLRLIIVENSGFFKGQNELTELLSDTPDTTVIIFVEGEVDKRNKLYKFIKDSGYVSEMNGLDDKNLKLFAASLFEQRKQKITEANISYLLDKIDNNMINISNEVEKISSYCGERQVVSKEDIDAVITVQITGKIFQMIDAIGSRQAQKALELYYDLIAVREKPLSILFLITRHFNIMLQIKDLQSRVNNSTSISELVGVPGFAVSKYSAQARNFSFKRLKDALEFSADIEQQIKTGTMDEKIGVELFIITFSKA
jgi:DNA polymerase-3 subunit delta